jgi:hypothetical protein
VQGIKSTVVVVLNWFGWNLPPQLADWPLVEVALLLIPLTHIFWQKPVLNFLNNLWELGTE